MKWRDVFLLSWLINKPRNTSIYTFTYKAPFHHRLIYHCPEGATKTIVMDQQIANPMASSSILSSAGAPSFTAGGSFDTLDFSLPSYDEATKGDTLDSDKAPAKAEKSSDAAAEKAAKKEQEAQERAERKVCVG